MIHNVLDNAWTRLRAACGCGAGVREDRLLIEVEDDGPGFTDETLENFGKPYNSTKGQAWRRARPLSGRQRPAQAGWSRPRRELDRSGGAWCWTCRCHRWRSRPVADRRLIIVEDDEKFRRHAEALLRRRGYQVVHARGLDEALAALETFAPTYAVVDLKLAEGGPGLACVRALSERDPAMLIVVLTGFASIATAAGEAIQAGPATTWPKPGQHRRHRGGLPQEEVMSTPPSASGRLRSRTWNGSGSTRPWSRATSTFRDRSASGHAPPHTWRGSWRSGGSAGLFGDDLRQGGDPRSSNGDALPLRGWNQGHANAFIQPTRPGRNPIWGNFPAASGLALRPIKGC
ncbi:response regulator [Caulobacter segnis]